MFSFFKPKFEVNHSGRGGTIIIKSFRAELSFNIEMIEKGNFLVFTGEDTKYYKIRLELRDFLNRTGRSDWGIVQ